VSTDADYRQASEFDHRFGRLKRLDFIVQTIRRQVDGRLSNSVNILEVGCGNGNLSLPLASLGYRVFGIDLDLDSLTYAARRSQWPNAHFIAMDVTRLGLLRAFDVVVCSEVIEHLPHPEDLLRALPGCLKPDGIALITTPNGYGPFELSSQLFYVQPLRLLKALGLGPTLKALRRKIVGAAHGPDSMNRGSPHVQFFTLRRLRVLLAQCGLSVTQVAHSDWLEGATPLTQVYGRVRGLSRLDQALADRLPSFMVSGWYLVCRPTAPVTHG